MSLIICDTSPIQYLHQLGLLEVFHKLSRNIIVPPAVAEELEEGNRQGIDLPKIRSLSWIKIRCPVRLELDFIINYDIKYRMGKELETEY